MSNTRLLTAVTVTGASADVDPAQASGKGSDFQGNMTLQASIAGTGAVTATVTLEGSNGHGWTVLKTLSLSGTNTDTKADSVQGQPWARVRANVTAISGTGAAVSASLGA